MNKGYHIVRFLLLLLIVLSLFVFVYWSFVKINILDMYYYRIDVFDSNEKVDFYRYEIESALDFLKNSVNMVLLYSVSLMLVCVYAFYKSK